MKNKNCAYGYMDESGSTGIAIHNNDYFIIAIALFPSQASALHMVGKISNLRTKLNLPADFEFHRKENSRPVQVAFINLLSTQKFNFLLIPIKKDHSKKTASYATMAKLIVSSLPTKKLKIIMDINPLLHQELSKELKLQSYHHIKVAEVKSHKEPLLQLADYLANLYHGVLKHNPKAQSDYHLISNKRIDICRQIS